MKSTSRLASLYSLISSEKDAERVLADLSIFWYAISAILIFISLTISILTQLKVFLSFPIILLFTGFFLQRRKSRVIPIFILLYSLGLMGFVLWYFVTSANTDFNHGIIPTLNNPLVGINTLVVLLPSLLVVLLLLCSWISLRSIKATFVYHKRIGSQPFWRNIGFAFAYNVVLPLLAPMTYLFTEIPWRYEKYMNIYEYFKGDLFIYTLSAIISISIFAILTRYFPLVRWADKGIESVPQKMIRSLYVPISSKEEAQSVLSNLSIIWYIYSVFFIIVAIVNAINEIDGLNLNKAHLVISAVFNLITVITFFAAGYFLPRKQSRVLSVFALILSSYFFLAVILYFIHLIFVRSTFFTLHWLAIIPNMLFLLLPFFVIFCAWVAFRCVVATFRYHKYDSRKYYEERRCEEDKV
jgi:hypothetical protein